MSKNPRIIVAVDFPDAASAWELIDRLEAGRCRLKVGKEMFTRFGPSFVSELVARGFEVFLDLKFHDIPNTVAAACEAAADLGVWMVNLHACGGRPMMDAARERLAQLTEAPLLIAVTVLTSLDAKDLEEIGCPGDPRDQVLRLASLARDAGLDGVVCSPREASSVRARLGGGFLLVTPGVRPPGTAVKDQKRVMTPRDALGAGADYLVIGRPITAASDPLRALADIEKDMPAAVP